MMQVHCPLYQEGFNVLLIENKQYINSSVVTIRPQKRHGRSTCKVKFDQEAATHPFEGKKSELIVKQLC